MGLARRALGIGESATLGVARRAAELRARGLEVADLGAGEPDFDSPPAAVEAAGQALAQGFTRYTAAAGLPELRAALAERYRAEAGAPWSAAECVVTVGAKAALFQLLMLLLEEGSEVVLPTPAWVSFPEQIRFAGGRAVAVPTSVSDGFAVHAEAVLAALGERTSVVLLNSPCNPTGSVMEAGELERIVAECARREIVVVSDETYERFVFGPHSHASAAALAAEHPETVVVVGSFSKTYAMTGWRVGYALGPPRIITRLAALQSHSTSNPTTFAMKGARAAMRDCEADVHRMVAEYEARRELLMEGLSTLPGVQCVPPGGAFYAFPRVADHYREGRAGSVAFADFLLERARVAVVPGVAFGDDAHVRLSFACSRETLAAGLERMAAALA